MNNQVLQTPGKKGELFTWASMAHAASLEPKGIQRVWIVWSSKRFYLPPVFIDSQHKEDK